MAEFYVSIVGIKQLMEEMVGTHAKKPDAEVQSFMLGRLKKENYIPSKAREDYDRAFVREFRKFLGQPYADEAPSGLDVKVLGAGCTQCNTLTQTNAAGIIPVVQALLGKGAALGTVLAFMMSVIALSLPEAIILRKVLKPRLIAAFFGVVGFGIFVVGYLFNLLL